MICENMYVVYVHALISDVTYTKSKEGNVSLIWALNPQGSNCGPVSDG